VTSGDYQRYYTYKGKIMHHIIDPDTLMPARHSRSVTVITDNSGIADILSTTLYTMSHEEGVKLINRLQKEENIQVNAIWVYDDIQKPENGTDAISVKGYQIVFSDGLKDKIKES
jgi:thiamine biosynthesis lipoprotein